MAGKYLDQQVARATEFINEQKANSSAFVLFVHTDPDRYGHLHGENSDRYLREFVRADRALGKISALVPDANIIVVADHGFDEGMMEHWDAPDSWMATNLPVKEIYRHRGEAMATMRDVAKAIYKHYGITPLPMGKEKAFPTLRGVDILK